MNRRYKLCIGICFLLPWFICSLPAQAETPPSKINLTFQVHDGDKFVPDLTLNDLVVYEEGRELPVESLELIQTGKVRRHEGEQQPGFVVQRNLILNFQAREYTSKLADAVDCLFKELLAPGDQVFVVTPVKIYGFSEQTMKNYTQEQLINAVNSVLKRDISSSGTSYLAIIEEMTRIIREMISSGDVKNLIVQYKQQLSNLETYRIFDDASFEKIAEEFGKSEGPTHLFLFYEQEFIPIPDSEMMEEIRRDPYLRFDAAELFDLEKKEIPSGGERIREAFLEAGVHFHFIYMKKIMRTQRRIVLREHSGDMFHFYQKLAQETDGIAETTSLPASGLRKAAESAAIYYRLTYTSPDRKKDGAFRPVAIKVKNKDYRVSVRSGYFD